MKVRASLRFARISPKKVRPVARLIVGRRVDEALYMLGVVPKRGAYLLKKVLASAAANAEMKEDVDCDVDEMIVARATVDDGPRLKRYRPAARGRAVPRLRRMCHITVELEAGEGGKDGAEG